MAAISLPFTLALACLLLALVAEARTLPDSYGLKVEIITRYGRKLSPLPPSPVPSPKSKETSLESNDDEFITPKVVMKSPPPPPKASPPKGQLETGYISMITNYERPPRTTPPSPRAAPPRHEVTFPCPEWGACRSFISVISGYGRLSRSPPSQKPGFRRSSA